MRSMNGFDILKNESGALTLDFIFAFSLTFALTLILFAVSFSLATFEVTQYVTFATARTYSGGHQTESLQRDKATEKFNQLTKKTPVISSLYNGGWFELKKFEIADFNSEYDIGDTRRQTFIGARVELNAKVLEFRLPLLGNTFDEEDGFTSRFASFLLRSPSYSECYDNFNKKRYQNIREKLGYNQAPQVNEYFITDNGC